MRASRRCASSSFAVAAKAHHGMQLELFLDVFDRIVHAVFRHHVVHGRVDENRLFALDQDFARERVDHVDVFDLLAEELDAIGELFVAGLKLDDVAAHAERAALEVDVVSAVLQVDQLAQHFVAIGFDVFAYRQHAVAVLIGRTEAEDARHRCHQQHVVTAHQVAGGRQSQAGQDRRSGWHLSRCRCPAAGCTLRAGSNRNS